MIDKHQLRELIVETLQHFDQLTEGTVPYSDEAVELLMMTAAHESKLGTYIRQINGPALGIFQMEPETYNDISENFLDYRPLLDKAVIAMAPMGSATSEAADELAWNLKLQIIMARLHYYRVPEGLPVDIEGLAEYAKEHYNTHLGKATKEKYLADYRNYAI
jgi:hypothetical protein